MLVHVLIAAVGCMSASGEDVLYRCDFGDKSHCAYSSRWVPSADGRSSTLTVGGFDSLTLKALPDFSGRAFSLVFDVREIKQEGKKAEGWWGLQCTSESGNRATLFTRGKGFNTVIKNSAGRLLRGDSPRGDATIVEVKREDLSMNEWSEVRVFCGLNGFRIYIDGKLCCSDHVEIAPMKELKFLGHGRNLQLRNLRIRAEKEPIADFADAPTIVRDGVVKPEEIVVDRPVSSQGGGIFFWAKYKPGSEVVKMLDGEGRTVASFYFCGDFRIQADVAIEGSKTPTVFRRRLGLETLRSQEETVHYAFTWSPDGSARFFLNGLPFATNAFIGDDASKRVSGNVFDAVAKVVVVDNSRRSASAEVRDLKVFRRPLANHEVLEEYRRKMPIDLVFQESLYTAGDAVTVRVAAAPGGYYMLPHPVEGAPFVKSKVDVEFVIERKLKKAFAGERVPGGETVVRGLDVSVPVDVALNPVKLEPGTYRVIAKVDGYYTRSMAFTAAKRISSPKVEATKEKWSKSGEMFSLVFDRKTAYTLSEGPLKVVSNATCGAYVECGPDGGHRGFDRAGVEVFFPESALGRPCLLEFAWPDDKARAMGLTMHAPHKGPKGNLRDSLMAGILAGGEVRNSGSLRTTQYLFFPAYTNYLFELRTMIKGRPAAVSSMRAYRLVEPLPKLKVHHPENLPYRRFGHQDEDQTFFYLLNSRKNGGTVGNMEELLRYFAYTGESAFQYSFVRYISTFAPVEGSSGTGIFPEKSGEYGPMLGIFQDNDIKFTGELSLMGEPHIARLNTTECKYREKGYVMLDNSGCDCGTAGFIGDAMGNFANPGLQRLYFSYLEDFLARHSRTGGLKAVVVPMLFGTWRGPECGYDDWNVNAFANETGNAGRELLVRRAKTALDFKARYELLWNGPLHDAWVKWRAEKVTEFYSRLVSFVRTTCGSDFKVHLALPSDAKAYVRNGIDVKALAAIDGVDPCWSRNYLTYYWNLFRNNGKTDIYATHYDPDSPHLKELTAKTGSVGLVRCGQAYFESFTGSLDQKNYCAYFQDVDLKHVGRDWLRELAFVVGVGDAQETVIGDQQLATLGVEDEAREFVQAYSALPAMPFANMPGSDARTVVGRSRATVNGTYFYLVNMTDAPCDVKVVYGCDEKPQHEMVVDLSTDEELSTDAFALRPYELRSFLVPGRTVAFGTLARVGDGRGGGAPVAAARRDPGYERMIADVDAEASVFGKLLMRGGEVRSDDARADAQAASREGLVYPVVYRPGKRLTGKLADWKDVLFEGRVEQLTGSTRAAQVANVKPSFKACVADGFLYVLLVVKDPVRAFGCAKGSLHMNDCFEVYLDPTFSHAFSMGEIVSQTFVTPVDASAAEMTVSSKLPWKAVPVEFEGGWGVELELPLSNGYFTATLFDGLRFGVNVSYCNNDHPGSRASDGKLTWSRLDRKNNSYQTPGVYGVWRVVMPKSATVAPVKPGPVVAANAVRRTEGGTCEDAVLLGSLRPKPAITRGFNADASERNCRDCVETWGGDNLRCNILPFQVSYFKKFSTTEGYVNCAATNLIAFCKNAKKYGVKLIVGFGRLPNKPGNVWATCPDEIIAYWVEVVRRVQPYKDAIWGLDLVNEPLDYKQLPMPPIEFRPFFCKAMKAIREVDKTSWFIYETGPGGEWDGFVDLVPLPDPRVIYSCHFYKPGSFTHQGVSASLLMDPHLMPEEQKGINLKYPDYYFGRWFDRDEMERQLQPVVDFQRKWNVPIYIGEFSCTSWGPKNSTKQWLDDILTIMEKHGWSWSYHNLNGWQGWNLDSADEVFTSLSKIPRTMNTGRAQVMLKHLGKKAPLRR